MSYAYRIYRIDDGRRVGEDYLTRSSAERAGEALLGDGAFRVRMEMVHDNRRAF